MIKMDAKKFSHILVEELVDNHPLTNARFFHEKNGIDSSNLIDADEIWKLFVRYNLETGGTKSEIVEKNWNRIPSNSILKNRRRLLERIELLEDLKCYQNFTYECPITFTKKKGFDDICAAGELFRNCAVVKLTEEIKWHRKHYKIAKIIVECAKRLLIQDDNGKNRVNLNDVVFGIFNKYRNDGESWKARATRELLKRFDNIKEYGNPPKVIVWMLSELGSPLHQINHWPNIDLTQLVPVDTHVQRLVVRFGFLSPNQLTNAKIQKALLALYPKEPRKLDFALYRLGGEVEENLCGKKPDCQKCKERLPRVYEACPAKTEYRI